MLFGRVRVMMMGAKVAVPPIGPMGRPCAPRCCSASLSTAAVPSSLPLFDGESVSNETRFSSAEDSGNMETLNPIKDQDWETTRLASANSAEAKLLYDYRTWSDVFGGQEVRRPSVLVEKINHIRRRIVNGKKSFVIQKSFKSERNNPVLRSSFTPLWKTFGFQSVSGQGVQNIHDSALAESVDDYEEAYLPHSNRLLYSVETFEQPAKSVKHISERRLQGEVSRYSSYDGVMYSHPGSRWRDPHDVLSPRSRIPHMQGMSSARSNSSQNLEESQCKDVDWDFWTKSPSIQNTHNVFSLIDGQKELQLSHLPQYAPRLKSTRSSLYLRNRQIQLQRKTEAYARQRLLQNERNYFKVPKQLSSFPNNVQVHLQPEVSWQHQSGEPVEEGERVQPRVENPAFTNQPSFDNLKSSSRSGLDAWTEEGEMYKAMHKTVQNVLATSPEALTFFSPPAHSQNQGTEKLPGEHRRARNDNSMSMFNCPSKDDKHASKSKLSHKPSYPKVGSAKQLKILATSGAKFDQDIRSTKMEWEACTDSVDSQTKGKTVLKIDFQQKLKGEIVRTSADRNGSEELAATRENLQSNHFTSAVVEAEECQQPGTFQEVDTAKAAAVLLMGEYRHLVHACDTEVAGIDVKEESPVDHGYMTCFSIYCGPDADFGDGKSRLWVDVLDSNKDVLESFKAYFEDPSIKKVWHNFSFDRHILSNHGIRAGGFHADTMHLARLWDSARKGAQGGYSLEALTSDPRVVDIEREADGKGHGIKKTSMKELFGRSTIKRDGTNGKLKTLRPVEELQRSAEDRPKWIDYSASDAVSTWHLWKSLQTKLKDTEWKIEGVSKGNMYDFYQEYWQPFGELLVQMESDGMLVDCGHLADIEKIARTQQQVAVRRFQKWACKYCPDALHMNVGSDTQIRQLLFGGTSNRNDTSISMPTERIFQVPNTENYLEDGEKVPKKCRPIVLRGIGVKLPVDSYTSSGWPAVSGASLKSLAGKIAFNYTILEDENDGVLSFDLPEEAAVSLTESDDSKKVANHKEDSSFYGKAYEAFGRGENGKEACAALAALCEVASINTLISNFIRPLQGGQIMGSDKRVHCSLNINTETGRLSARRPSLQNQPALEKDRYKIRQAFVASKGKSLIVADYGQLELRILAHLANCKSMLDAFEAGGDFHSRTAMNMYSHICEAVKNGSVILEWDQKAGEDKPPVPLLKDVYAAERRKAKMLNFSIAYGKTARGLSKDWKVSLPDAEKTVELWYNDRMEVKQWQEQSITEARATKRVHTLLGRTRHLPYIRSSDYLERGHAERAAINTPVQGSAADVAMCAMLEISRNHTLKELGWKLVLQVHDEVILEGPTESAEVAKKLVMDSMSYPFNGENWLRVKLDVDCKYADSWYAAK
ncbi:hypothetical protein O6H91_15G073700 [Diphasiastrum complanatum]|uniref:Uncharacterized protein n=1 Tax=Diphasiastrum complanatum TaxID=34168 RepID=A0ACC2BJN3_DIPCM|nr:hypothetical protein O6H91_15G073700 [Diphasiastrum complanatum]